MTVVVYPRLAIDDYDLVDCVRRIAEATGDGLGGGRG